MSATCQHTKLWSQPTTHYVSAISPNDKNIELRVILLERMGTFEIKNGDTIYQFLVADHSGCIKCNFFGEQGAKLKAGDIVHMSGIYATLYKETTLTLYIGKRSTIHKIGEFFMHLSVTPHMSETHWERDTATGQYYHATQ